mmetsp:Transcript_40534/g.102039  ORF Transcript_40534/g.102039 Transcript_40534/m.102039 type:complete len:139 (+) Transcript_40534:88-504(+)
MKYDLGSVTHYSLPRKDLKLNPAATEILEERKKDYSKKVGKVCMPSVQDVVGLLKKYFPTEVVDTSAIPPNGVKYEVPDFLKKKRQNTELLLEFGEREDERGKYDEVTVTDDYSYHVEKHYKPDGELGPDKIIFLKKD